MREKKMNIVNIYALRDEGKKIAAVSLYDYTTAKLAHASGIDMLLVGDSAAEVMLGYDSTLPATMDFMVAITAGVRRGAPDAFLAADMPFLSYNTGIDTAINNAGRFIVESGADIVKIEATANDLDVVRAVTNAGIAVMAHIGIRPQSVALLGRLKAEGTTAENACELISLARAMVDAGARMLLLEGTAAEVARIITQRSPVPVIGCGSGPWCDGQILICSDILGLTDGPRPKFAMSFGQAGKACCEAFDKYAKEVRQNAFPDSLHSYHLKPGNDEKLAKMLENQNPD